MALRWESADAPVPPASKGADYHKGVLQMTAYVPRRTAQRVPILADGSIPTNCVDQW